MSTLANSTENRIKKILESISDFSDECSKDDYTDTGDAWHLLHFIEQELSIAVCEHEIDPESVRHFTHAIFRFNCKKCKGEGESLIGADQLSW